MKKLAYIILLALGLTFISSCNRLDIAGMVINRSDTEERVADWLDWDAQNEPIVINNVPDNYTFYSCSDIHLNDDKTRFADYITKERNDLHAAFSIIAGDIANEGLVAELEAFAKTWFDVFPGDRRFPGVERHGMGGADACHMAGG